MDDISSEQKLQLVQQIRNQHNRNQYDMFNRERILYNKTSAVPFSPSHEGEVETNVNIISESRKFRCAVAAMIFIFAVLFDLFGVQPCGLEMKQIFTYIAADYSDNMQEIAETLTNHILEGEIPE